MIESRIDRDFKLVIFSFLVCFYISTLYLFIYGGDASHYFKIMGVDLIGIFRAFMLWLFVILLIIQFAHYPHPIKQERKLVLSFILFIFLLFVQCFLVGDKFFHVRGSLKYFFYFTCVLLSIGSCYYYSDNTRNLLMNVGITCFASVMIFYPYIIYRSGMNLFERIQVHTRMHFLLGAGNEDAGLMLCFLPLALTKLYGKKMLTGLFLMLYFVAMIYNGTRSMLIMSYVAVVLFYLFITKKKILYILLVFTLIMAVSPIILHSFGRSFKSEYGLVSNPRAILEGRDVGGTLSFRVTKIWLPMIDYTLRRSPWIGFGSNSWYRIGRETRLITMYQKVRGTVVGSPHNLFIYYFVQWGIMGLFIFIYIFYSGIRNAWSNIRNSLILEEKVISVAIFCSWIGYFTWSMLANSNSEAGMVIFMILILLSISQKNCILLNNMRTRIE